MRLRSERLEQAKRSTVETTKTEETSQPEASRVSNARFTDAEMALFEDRLPAVATWGRWLRHQAPEGRDILEIFLEGRRPIVLRLVKTDDGRYAASGFDGWSLTVCDDFETLLDVVARLIPAASRDTGAVAETRSAA
jgi:hypothetical protein